MSAGQGDQIGEIAKDDEREISSTTPDTDGLIPSVSHTDTSETVPLAISTVKPLEIAKEDASVIPITELVDETSSDKLDIDFNVASTTKLVEECKIEPIVEAKIEPIGEAKIEPTMKAIIEPTMEAKIKSIVEAKIDSDQNSNAPDEVPDTEDNTEPQESENVKDLNLDKEPKLSTLKEINEIILADADKDSSSLGEDLELRWEDDDDDENETIPTTDVLKQLDRELEKITSDNSQEANIETEDLKPESGLENTDKNITESTNLELEDSSKSMKVKSSDNDNIIQDVQMPSGNDACDNQNIDKISTTNENLIAVDAGGKLHGDDDVEMAGSTSFEESPKIIDQIDNLTKVAEDIEMENVTEISSSEIVENPQIDQTDSLAKDSIQDIDMEKGSIETEIINENLTTKEAEITSELSSKSVEVMDVDILTDKTSKDATLSENNLTIESPNPNFNAKVDEKVLDNVDSVQKSDIATSDVLETNEAFLNKTDENQDSVSQSDVPSVNLPIEVTNISDNVETLNESKEFDSNTPTNELSDATKKVPETDCKDKLNTEVADENTSQTGDNSLLETTITPNVHHRINKPNVMLDIPTQELSDIEAELDDDLELNEDDEETREGIKIANVVEKSPKIDDIGIKDISSNKILTESHNIIYSTPKSKVLISPAIEIDATSSKLNITTVSPTKLETARLIQVPSTSKSLKFDLKPTSKPDTPTETPTSTIKQEIDGGISTSKSIEDIKPSTSTPSTSTSVQDNDDAKPSTSKLDVIEKMEPDNTDSDQEVTDSLGLLAESSRVMDDDNDDDEDADDQEVDDNDDDEDFDPYEETNSEMAEDMDDSNSPPPELDPKIDNPEPSKVLEGRESDEGTMDVPEVVMDIVDDIECVENELPEMELPDDAASETASNEECAAKAEPEIIDADTHKEKPTTKCPPEKIINILEKVLGQRNLTGAKCKDASSMIGNVRNYVELEGSSSDSDDVLEVSKSDISEPSDVISVNIPEGVEVMSTSGPHGTSEIVSKKGEVIISGVPKPPPQKMSKINTSEVTIKTTATSGQSIHIPETSVTQKSSKEEIFSLDSDEEDTEKKESSKIEENVQDESSKTDRKCINPECTSETRTYYQADRATAAYYSLTRRSAVVCERCRERASERSEALLNGIKDLRPLLELDMEAPSQQLVEISDSDSDGEGNDDTPRVGERGATYLEEHLADMINQTWVKYKLESRLKDTERYLMDELEKMEAGAKEIDAMLNECQKKTDAIRIDFYKDYELRRRSLGGIVIHDTPFSSYSHTEKDIEDVEPPTPGSRYPKRRAASIADTPAKKAAIPMGYMPLDGEKMVTQSDVSGDQSKDDDKEDISVVKLSAESAPADLPPCGEIVRPALKTGMVIYAMRNAFGTWLKGRIMDVQPKAAGQQFTQCRVKFEHKIKNPCKVLAARCLAYPDPCEVRMTIGTRVVALFKDPHNTTRRDSFYSGVIAEIPNPVNSYRYLVFFDDGYAQYVHHQHTRVVCECSNLVWEEVHPFIRDFICNYLLSYPERPMVRLHAGEKLKTEWNGKWWDSKVLQVDASIALINFDEDNRTEWIYRGSTRLAPLYLELQAAEKAGEGRTRSRLPRSKAQMRSNMPCVEYTRSDEQAAAKAVAETQALHQHNEEMRRQRAVAKKSTTMAAQTPTAIPGTPFEGVISRVVYYTPKNAVKPYKMAAHTCTIKCRRSDLLSLKDLRTYNPLAKPLLSGWERQTVRYKGHRDVVYRAPCGRRLRNMAELHRYLRILQSDLSVDLFDFTPGTHCLAEFVLHKCIVSKKDLSHGKENVPVPCVNYYDDSLPEFCSYNTERTPTAGVPLNLDPDFLCGCDCTDDCVDKSKCACWKMTLEGARTIGLEGPNVGYVYRRLPEPLPSGIYECNSRCKCKQTCLNRVAQHPLQLKLQVFKTINRGWGIRALNDVPKGAFLCVYAGNLLTDATANLDGLNEGDEYLAELDYIEVVEGMKEGYEDDVPDADKQLDKKRNSSDSESEPSSESEDERDKAEKDGDFRPGYIPQPDTIQFKKSLRKREKAKRKEEQEKQREEVNKKDDCITISDDEEVREPSRFTAQAGMVDRDLISKQSSRVSVRTLFGKDEACYIMDAKVQGNIGRYLNHSCHPNVFVQNVFVDTHDPRFPWVAFFALSHVRAGTELTWNYNYDVGSVPEKVLYCYCGAPNCRGRLL